MRREQVINWDPDILGGTPIFAGTRVPVQTLIDYLKAGDSLDDFLEGFPSVSRFEIVTVTDHGWSGMKNSELLRAAEAEFDALVAMNKGIEHQQNLNRINLGIVLISARSNRRHDVEPAMPEVNRVLRVIRAGEVIRVTA